MSNKLITESPWKEITLAALASRRPSFAAVAYYGQGANKLLPLFPGSCVVVDASEVAVKAGQTDPRELLKAIRLGVRVFSRPNLHAKVFIFGRAVYVGSTNASGRSANTLSEAVVRLTDPKIVLSARKYVEGLCLHELTPQVLRKLAKIYRPPMISGSKGSKQFSHTQFRLQIAQVEEGDWSESELALDALARPDAEKRRLKPQTFKMDSIRWNGRCNVKEGDIIVLVIDRWRMGRWIYPPGNVIHLASKRIGRAKVTLTYLEFPARRLKSFDKVVARLGRGSRKQLISNGVVRNRALGEKLLAVLAK